MPLASLTPGFTVQLYSAPSCVSIPTSCSTDNLTMTMEEVVGATSLDSSQPAKVLFSQDNRYVQDVVRETR